MRRFDVTDAEWEATRAPPATALGGADLRSSLGNGASDVTLVCGKTKVRAHRAVLCARSSFMRDLLADVDAGATVTLPGGNGALFKEMVDFVYAGDAADDAWSPT